MPPSKEHKVCRIERYSGFWTSEFASWLDGPRPFPSHPLPTANMLLCGLTTRRWTGENVPVARTSRILRTDVSAVMIYQALKIEIRHGSAADHSSPLSCSWFPGTGGSATVQVKYRYTGVSTKEKKIANKKRLYQGTISKTYCLAYRHLALINP